ncbi:MAG: hypothetical protein ILA03_06705 [Bacteroidaceae bacterium]|nr:hypothetical protein [Bacteroidaceae bacterium]
MIFLLLIIAFLIVSCSARNDGRFIDPLEHFNDQPAYQLKANNRIDLDCYEIYKPWAITREKGTYFIYDDVGHDLIKVLNPQKGTIKKGVNRGSGPGEIILSEGFYKMESTTGLIENNRMMLYKLNVSTDSVYLTPHIDYNSFQFLYNPAFYNDRIISTAFNDSVWIRYYEGNRLVSTIDYPHFEETEHLSGGDMAWAFISMRFRFKPDGKRAVGALQSGCLISFFDCTESGISESVQHKYFPLDFAYTGKESRSIGETPDCRVGFCGLTCTDNYIYALYSGKTMENLTSAFRASHVFVYDWEGRPVKRYELEKELFGDIGVDEDAGILYGISYDPEGCIIEYKLN